MPEGIETTVEDGFATIDFIDPTKRGPGIKKLVDNYGPAVIETLTRTGPRRMYRVPEGNAREVGLIDSPADPVVVVVENPSYDDGLPDADWSRGALNDYAATLGIADAAKLPNKAAVLAAIRAK